MSRSKMEEYLSILEVLILQPLKLKKISHKANIKETMLKKRIDFLLSHMLIKERYIEKEEPNYAITDIGLAVLKRLKAHELSEKIYQHILRTRMHEQEVHVYPEIRS